MNMLINVVAFKIGWLSAVFGSANGLPIAGPVVITAAVAIHLYLAAEPQRELLLVLLTGLIGGTWDSVMVSAGWVSYPTGTLVSGLAPYWILAMWMLFATTLNVAFRKLRSYLWVAAVLGAVSGPLSYYAGGKLGAIRFDDFRAAMIALTIAWALLLPALLLLARQFDGVRPESVPGEA